MGKHLINIFTHVYDKERMVYNGNLGEGYSRNKYTAPL
jgi:hypothetical protein